MSEEALDLLQGTAHRMTESASAMVRNTASSPETMMERSLAHRDLVKAHEAGEDMAEVWTAMAQIHLETRDFEKAADAKRLHRLFKI